MKTFRKSHKNEDLQIYNKSFQIYNIGEREILFLLI